MIRKAKISDAKIAVKLLYIAAGELLFDLTGTNNENSALLKAEEFFISKNNRMSFENIYLYEISGVVAGLMCLYDGEKAEILDEALNENLRNLGKNYTIEKECENDFYLDSLAVLPEFRRRGISSELINYAFEISHENGKFLSLLVDCENKIAQQTYDKMGFCYEKTKNLYGHDYFYLVKKS